MRTSAETLFLLLLSFLLSAPQEALAAPIVGCPEPDETANLSPLAAFVAGEQVFRNASGRFTNDAGFEFHVERVEVRALPGAVDGGCVQPSRSITAVVIDPFTGAAHTLTLQVSP